MIDFATFGDALWITVVALTKSGLGKRGDFFMSHKGLTKIPRTG